MQIGNIIIHRASTVKNILNKYRESQDTYKWKALFHFYQCRFLGICIYRTWPEIEGSWLKLTGEYYPKPKFIQERDDEFSRSCISLIKTIYRRNKSIFRDPKYDLTNREKDVLLSEIGVNSEQFHIN